MDHGEVWRKNAEYQETHSHCSFLLLFLSPNQSAFRFNLSGVLDEGAVT